MLMLKDNHIDYCGNIEKAIDKAWRYVQQKNPDLKIEVETRNLDEVKQVYKAGQRKVFRIMLDNFTPQQITEALDLIQEDFETEASGGINLENIESFAATGVDFISVEPITQAQSVDKFKSSDNLSGWMFRTDSENSASKINHMPIVMWKHAIIAMTLSFYEHVVK